MGDENKKTTGPYVIDKQEIDDPETPNTGYQQTAKDIIQDPKTYSLKTDITGMTGDPLLDNLSPEKQADLSNRAKIIKDYGADWSKGFSEDALKNSKLTLSEGLQKYRRYSQEHPDAPQIDMMDFYLLKNKGYDLGKSIADNEKDKKKAENREKWEKIQNALFSFADMYNAAKGAPAPENAETPVQLTKRQEERRDKVKTMRDKDWQSLQTLWTQQNADDMKKRQLAIQEAKQRADEDRMRQELDVKIRDAKIRGNKAELDIALLRAKTGYQEAKTENDKKLWDARIKQIEALTKYTNERSRGGGNNSGPYEKSSSTTVTEGYDSEGRKTKTTNTTESKQLPGSSQRSGGKTPPSRNNGSKTPPSRRK